MSYALTTKDSRAEFTTREAAEEALVAYAGIFGLDVHIHPGKALPGAYSTAHRPGEYPLTGAEAWVYLGDGPATEGVPTDSAEILWGRLNMVPEHRVETLRREWKDEAARVEVFPFTNGPHGETRLWQDPSSEEIAGWMVLVLDQNGEAEFAHESFDRGESYRLGKLLSHDLEVPFWAMTAENVR